MFALIYKYVILAVFMLAINCLFLSKWCETSFFVTVDKSTWYYDRINLHEIYITSNQC